LAVGSTALQSFKAKVSATIDEAKGKLVELMKEGCQLNLKSSQDFLRDLCLQSLPNFAAFTIIEALLDKEDYTVHDLVADILSAHHAELLQCPAFKTSSVYAFGKCYRLIHGITDPPEKTKKVFDRYFPNNVPPTNPQDSLLEPQDYTAASSASAAAAAELSPARATRSHHTELMGPYYNPDTRKPAAKISASTSPKSDSFSRKPVNVSIRAGDPP
jgi:hypothetical protein